MRYNYKPHISWVRECKIYQCIYPTTLPGYGFSPRQAYLFWVEKNIIWKK